MSEYFKDCPYYSAPKALPHAPIPPAPKKVEEEKSNIFILNPKSLPTDLRQYERPRLFHEQLKLQPKLEYVKPRLLQSKVSDKKLTVRACNLYGTRRDPPKVERHVMLPQGKVKPFKKMPLPLKMVRKQVSDVADSGDTTAGHLTREELKQIAPDGGAISNKRYTFQKKTRQVYEHDAVAREARLREAKPWVLSNGKGEEELRGTVEQGSQARYVALVMRKEGGFRVYPVSRLYKFAPRPSYYVPNAAETEELLNSKKINMEQWFCKKKGLNVQAKGGKAHKIEKVLGDLNGSSDEENSKFTTVEGYDGKRSKKQTKDDAEELDYDEDFQDDEEMGMGDGEEYEETKQAESRDRKRQKRLNPVSSSDSSDVDSDEELTKNDPSVKRLKKMDGYGHSDDEEGSQDEQAPQVAVRKLEAPKVTKPLAKKPTPAPARPKSSAADVFELPSPFVIANIVKRNPSIDIKQLLQELNVDTGKLKKEVLSKFMNLLNSVVYKSKDGSVNFRLHKAYM